MLLALAKKMFGSSNERALKSLYSHVEPINALEAEMEKLSDAQIRAKTDEFRTRLEKSETEDDLMHEAFAVVREAAKRTLGQRHFDVQLVGGVALHTGKIAEMKTGEGKTLVGTLPVYLNAISGKGVHVVTVNDYLASRDAEWMGQIYEFLGLTVGCITADHDNEERQKAYQCDITYCTNNELGFDYLRDNMKFQLNQMVQRGFNFAIIDEVDSILIDEARTPLIISGPSDTATEMYQAVDKLIPHLVAKDFDLDEKMKTVTLTDEGTEHAEQLLTDHGILEEGGLYDANNISLVHHLNQALRAHKLFSKDTDYIVKDNKVIIIDEFTGRMMEGRRFSDGLHQALEARENVEVQSENQTLASITFQNYFRLYPKLGGMTGTALTEAAEFEEIYKLGVVEIPTNVHIGRLDHDDKIFKSLKEKEDAIVELVKKAHERDQPTLIGTVSIEKSEQLSARLKKEKIPHSVLNARYHEQEAQIISQAGRLGAVTIATNMAGRGTDIQLGGNIDMRAEAEIDESWTDAKKAKTLDKIKEEVLDARQKVRESGGLLVLGTERHESRRIDNQLRGRSGRQGDPGETIFFLSLEDDLMRIFGSDKMQMLLAHKKIGLRDGEALTHPWISRALAGAQAKVEQQNFEIRKNLLKFDDVMNDQRKVVYEQRREIMEEKELGELVEDLRHGFVENIVSQCIPERSYAEKWDTETLQSEVLRVLAMDLPIQDWAKEEGIADDEILERIMDAADKKMATKASNAGPQVFRRLEKSLVLQTLDLGWKDHLLNLDHLRQGINLRAFGQRDPLNEYKAEAFAMFEMMLDNFGETVTQTLSLVEINLNADSGKLQVRKHPSENEMQTTRQDPALMGVGVQNARKSAEETAAADNVRPMERRTRAAPAAIDPNDQSTWGRVTRNEPCPCGSGQKYKQCHGKI